MNQESKQLVLKDLCARLPYGVKFEYNKNVYTAKGLDLIVTDEGYWDYAVTAKGVAPIEIDFIKPYLFPLSSMTEEQFLELTELCNMYDNYHDYNPYEYWGIQVCRKHIHGNKPCFSNNYKAIDWYNKNHFDYRGLIEKGLALDATNLGIY